jgi:hypothetical protein
MNINNNAMDVFLSITKMQQIMKKLSGAATEKR